METGIKQRRKPFYSTDNKNHKHNQTIPKEKWNVGVFLKIRATKEKRHLEDQKFSANGQIRTMFKSLAENFDIYHEEDPHKFDTFKSHARITKNPARFLEEC